MQAGWSSWCLPAGDLPAELRTGEDPVCGQPFPQPVPPVVLPPYYRCRDRMVPAFTATVRPADRMTVEGLTAALGIVAMSAAQGDAVWFLAAGETSLVASGSGPTAVVLSASGPHGDVTYRATVGVVVDHRFPSARINVRHRARVIEITLRRPARLSVCIRTTAWSADRLVPLDLGVRPAGITRLRLGPRAREVALRLATPEGLTGGPVSVFIRPRA